MNPTELILAKRAGRELSDEEIAWLVANYTEGQVADYQMSAFLMAVYFKGMTPRETAAYTRAMIESGERYDLDSVPGVKVDKHSTGGVGDKVSLVLAPLAASAGLVVPMMSGRGLGHSGGTLDKLEAIPGFTVELQKRQAIRQLQKIGVVMIGQTRRVAPADRKLYALRDVTGTIESIPLICGSILSKKVAAGVEALVMDIKTGSGAFMQTLQDAEQLADALVAIGSELGLRIVSCITDMDQPLGLQIGNSLEVIEAIECLRGGGPGDLRELVLTLAAEMIRLAGESRDLESARALATERLDGGAALEKFRELVAAQGGDTAIVDHPERLELASAIEDIVADRDGYLSRFDTRQIGLACNALGAGRIRIEDSIDPGVGITLEAKRGDAVRKGNRLARIRHREGRGLREAISLFCGALHVADTPPPPRPLTIRRIARE